MAVSTTASWKGWADRFPVLHNVFYVQAAANANTKQTTSVLIRRGKEWHAPDNGAHRQPHSAGQAGDRWVEEWQTCAAAVWHFGSHYEQAGRFLAVDCHPMRLGMYQENEGLARLMPPLGRPARGGRSHRRS